MLQYHLNDSIDVSSRNKDFIERSIDWIVSHFTVGSKTSIIDFGCGPGLYTTGLAEKGATVTGIDFSKNSLHHAEQVARRKGLKIDYVHTNYLDFESSYKFDLITMIMCDYCALSPEQRAILLTKFSSLLNPGGAVLLDVYSHTSFNQKEESATYELNQLHGFWSPQDYYCFVNTFKYEREKVTLDKYTIIEQAKTRTVYNWLQHFSTASMQEEFNRNGFEIDEFYANVAGETFTPESAEFAVVARKSPDTENNAGR
ncbi:class I SAM-dependent methyltransferase [Desulforhopalus singaporensis]|nr:class I SAM-dependent methyltransferase [Desulforhopalus singaporensis]